MKEAQCTKCKALFEIDEAIPKNMVCFCNNKEFALLEPIGA